MKGSEIMTVLGFFLGFILILQIFVLVGICRTNNKLNELESKVSVLNDLIVPAIGISSDNAVKIARILDMMGDTIVKIYDRKKYKKKKKEETFYADNESES